MGAIGDLYKDGHSTTDQGVHGKARSKGSSVIKRDVSDAVNWWSLLPRIEDIPTLPLDENGVPYRLCGHCGEYVKRAGFRKDASRKSGLDDICKDCRHQQYMNNKKP